MANSDIHSSLLQHMTINGDQQHTKLHWWGERCFVFFL